VGLSYFDPGCEPTDEWGCGLQVPYALAAALPGSTATASIAAGTGAELEDFLVLNGTGSSCFTELWCDDVPDCWRAGFVAPIP
jgi:hypothetical protein